MGNSELQQQDTKKNPKALGIWGLSAICVGFTITLNNFAVGAGVFSGLTFGKGIIAIVVAWVAMSLVWIFSGLIGASTRKNAATIFRYVFGTQGYRIPSICMAVALAGFAVFDYWFVGSAMANMFPGNPSLAFIIGIIIITACAILGTIKDITSLKWLSQPTIPFAIVLFVIIMVVALSRAGGIEAMVAYKPVTNLPLLTAINILFSSFVIVTSGFSDITCHAKNKKSVLIAMPLCMLAVAFQFVVSQIGVIGYAIVDFTSLALALGGAMFYICNVFTFFAQANTVPAGTLIISTQISESTPVRKLIVCFVQPIVCGIGAILLFFGADISIVTNFSSLLGCMFGPLLGIIFAEFWVVRKRKLEDDAKLPKFSLSGCICLFGGFVAGIYLTFFSQAPVPVAILLLVVCFIVHIILRRGVRLA